MEQEKHRIKPSIPRAVSSTSPPADPLLDVSNLSISEINDQTSNKLENTTKSSDIANIASSSNSEVDNNKGTTIKTNTNSEIDKQKDKQKDKQQDKHQDKQKDKQQDKQKEKDKQQQSQQQQQLARVLEVGAGCGLVSCSLGLQGCWEVTATEISLNGQLDLLQKNIDANKKAYEDMTTQVRELDWTNPAQIESVLQEQPKPIKIHQKPTEAHQKSNRNPSK